MKILVICQYYYPEPFRVNDICEEMVKRGHEVTVVTGEPNYPEGQIYKGYENHAHADEIINGVKVHRCAIIPRKTGALYRFLNYFSYPHQAKKYIKNLLVSDGKPFDVVFVNQLSPVMMADPAISYKKKYGTPVLMYCLDLWPESLVAGGVDRNSSIYKIFYKISCRIYRQMDRILITSRMFRGYLEQKFEIGNDVIGYLPQYAEDMFEKLPQKESGEVTNLVFAGNIGAAQSLDTVLKAAEFLKDELRLSWHIVGDGSELKNLKKMASEKNLNNVIFYGRKSSEEMRQYYAKADAMLVTLTADRFISMTLPGKVQTYMATGKPIIGAASGEIPRVIEAAQCGYCAKAEDAKGLAKVVRRFISESGDKRDVLGKNARKYYEKNFSRDAFMDHIERELLEYATR